MSKYCQPRLLKFEYVQILNDNQQEVKNFLGDKYDYYPEGDNEKFRMFFFCKKLTDLIPMRFCIGSYLIKESDERFFNIRFQDFEKYYEILE